MHLITVIEYLRRARQETAPAQTSSIDKKLVKSLLEVEWSGRVPLGGFRGEGGRGRIGSWRSRDGHGEGWISLSICILFLPLRHKIMATASIRTLPSL